MARKKREEEGTSVVVPRKGGGEYKYFRELTEDEFKDLLFYEGFVARVNGWYVKDYTADEIRKKYDGCSFPPFVLDTMRLIRKAEEIKYFE